MKVYSITKSVLSKTWKKDSSKVRDIDRIMRAKFYDRDPFTRIEFVKEGASYLMWNDVKNKKTLSSAKSTMGFVWSYMIKNNILVTV